MQTISDVLDECRSLEITSLDEITDQERKNYLCSVVVLASPTADILNHVANNDDLIHVLTTAAMITKNHGEGKEAIGYVKLHECIEEINNSFAKYVIDDLLQRTQGVPNLDDSL